MAVDKICTVHWSYMNDLTEPWNINLWDSYFKQDIKDLRVLRNDRINIIHTLAFSGKIVPAMLWALSSSVMAVDANELATSCHSLSTSFSAGVVDMKFSTSCK